MYKLSMTSVCLQQIHAALGMMLGARSTSAEPSADVEPVSTAESLAS